MSLFHLLRVEAGRLLRGRLTLFALAATALGPWLGLWAYQPLGDASVNGALLGSPALAGALVGAAAFAALTALEMDRVHRAGVDVLAEAVSSPLLLDAARVICLLLAALLAQAVTLALYLPYTAIQAGAVFRPGLYAAVYLTVMLPALAMSVLFTAAAYQITRRLDLTLALFAAFALLSLTAFSENWLLRWINPALDYLSDVFGNVRRLRGGLEPAVLAADAWRGLGFLPAVRPAVRQEPAPLPFPQCAPRRPVRRRAGPRGARRDGVCGPALSGPQQAGV